MATRISLSGLKRPAPKAWRNFKRGLLTILIPAAIAIIQGMKFEDPEAAIRLTLWINVGLVAVVKFAGMMLVDTGDNYVSNLPEGIQNRIPDATIDSVAPKPKDNA